MSLNMTFIFKNLLAILILEIVFGDDPPCVCPGESTLCKQFPYHQGDDKKQVIVISNSSLDHQVVKNWRWDSLTHILDHGPWDNNSDHVMCETHRNNHQYGFYVEFPAGYNASDLAIQTFINTTRNRTHHQFVDFVGVDLLRLLGQCGNSDQHIDDIINVTDTAFKALKDGLNIEIYCVMPWEPPCLKTPTCGITPHLGKICDGMMLYPESYVNYCEDSCIAKATVQASKLYYGLTEYEAYGFPAEKILMGIPWYGYNYTCESFSPSDTHPVCRLKMKPSDPKNSSSPLVCDLEGSRTKIRLGAIEGNKMDIVVSDGLFNRGDQAPYFVYNATDKSNTTYYMAWYEDIASLFFKYQLAVSMKLKGAVVFSGDDLTYTDLGEDVSGFDTKMWGWILHFLLQSPDAVKNEEKNYAGMMAGIGIALFLVGAVLGIILTCIALRRSKQPLRRPFSRDPAEVDDYHDDDNQQL